MSIHLPPSRFFEADHDYPRGMTVTLFVVMGLSCAISIGVGVAIWRFFQ